MSHRALGQQLLPFLPVAINAVGRGSLRGVFHEGEHREVEVPVDRLRATQDRLSLDHAERIAGKPKAYADQLKKRPAGYEHPDGSVWLEDGHHRAAAHILRGDETVKVKIKGTVHPDFHGWPAGQTRQP